MIILEDCVEPTSMLYSCPNVTARQHEVKLNVGTPTPMRGPGRTPALFGIESALDDLAIKLNMDPLEIRLRNYAEKDEGSNKPWSSKHLREAYQLGAEKFGWSKRNPTVGSMRNGNEILGWGMGTCTWPANQRGAEVRVRLLADGRARVSCATQDIGTGTYTVFAEIVSDRTGIPLDKIDVVLGDSSLPPGPTSGGSSATASVVPAIAQATDKAIQAVLKAAPKAGSSPFAKADPKTLKFGQGRVYAGEKSPETGVRFEEVLQANKLVGLDGQAKTNETEEQKKFSKHSFGAHFCEISFDPEIFRLRVTRWLTVMDGGRMINLKTARNQIIGGVVMGISMGLFEETIYDVRNGKPVNNNFADYLVPVNADIPEIDVVFLDYPDQVMSEYGARGIGEIGLTGCASALTMATYHATGVRVRRVTNSNREFDGLRAACSGPPSPLNLNRDYAGSRISSGLGYSEPFYIPGQPINQNGSASNSTAVAPNLFNYLPLPIDPTTGAPVGAGNALSVPMCAQLDHGDCVYSLNGLPQGHRNAYTGPGYWNLNFVIAKTFKLTERFNMQFRSEFYDAFNHSNYYINAGNLDVEQGTGVTAIQAVKGEPGGALLTLPLERRNIQFGLKLNF